MGAVFFFAFFAALALFALVGAALDLIFTATRPVWKNLAARFGA